MEQEIFKNKLKKAVIDGKTSMYGRPRTNEEIFEFKQKVLKLYASGYGI